MVCMTVILLFVRKDDISSPVPVCVYMYTSDMTWFTAFPLTDHGRIQRIFYEGGAGKNCVCGRGPRHISDNFIMYI